MDKNIIYFGLLGSFSYGNGLDENVKNSAAIGKVGKKTMSFLQYLIVNHGRSISAEELIELFWTESNSSDPGNALRSMLFKVRNLLKNMFPEYDNLLLTMPDCYVWNPEFTLELDTERFEAACVGEGKKDEDEYCERIRSALSLYRGDFLNVNDNEWVRAPRQYYRTLFLDACKAVLPLLYKKEQWMDVVAICNQAYSVDFAVEDFTAYQMQALISLGQPEQAVEKYQVFRDNMLREFEMPPTERIEQIYTLAVGLLKHGLGEGDILQIVCKEDRESHAFFCTFSAFQSIVSLERRHLERTGLTSTLVLVSLGGRAVPGTDARRLERILLEKLRAGDPVARLEARSYIMMLTGADLEGAQVVAGRIDCSFHKTYRHSKANLTFRMAVLKSQNK